jgi:hypothetical protein
MKASILHSEFEHAIRIRQCMGHENLAEATSLL